jgi:hypothetical protein
VKTRFKVLLSNSNNLHGYISVYFTLRFQEIAGSLEADMNGHGLVQAAPDAPGNSDGGLSKQSKKGGGGGGGDVKFLLASTAGSWAALRKCWAEDIFTAQIADRFVRLSAQILSRYSGGALHVESS